MYRAGRGDGSEHRYCRRRRRCPEGEKNGPEAAERLHARRREASAPVAPDPAGTAAQEREGRETDEELPSPEPAPETLQERRDGQGGVRGTVQLLCGGCGSTIGTFLKNRQAEFRCKCGDSIDLTRPLARFEYTCPYCEAKIRGLTNMEEPDITIKCRCGSPVDLQWVPKIREYRN